MRRVAMYRDADKDGIPNYRDTDSDGDSVPDSVEGSADTDGDGAADFLDLDSDGDGILDPVEGVDGDGDGILNATEAMADSDGDGVPNYLDLDSDNDGMPDAFEGTPHIPLDTDGDGTPDFLDRDSDGDGISDALETGPNPSAPVDTDSNGVPDFRQPISTDQDGDGIPDSVELGANPAHPADSDNDGKPDFMDPDSDNDGIPDAVEAGPAPASPVDTDGDGKPNYRDLDTDSDGVPDAAEGATDADRDGVPNYMDLDSDGDGILDRVEDGRVARAHEVLSRTGRTAKFTPGFHFELGQSQGFGGSGAPPRNPIDANSIAVNSRGEPVIASTGYVQSGWGKVPVVGLLRKQAGGLWASEIVEPSKAQNVTNPELQLTQNYDWDGDGTITTRGWAGASSHYAAFQWPDTNLNSGERWLNRAAVERPYVGGDTSVAVDSNDAVHMTYWTSAVTRDPAWTPQNQNPKNKGYGALRYATNAGGSWVHTTIATRSCETSVVSAVDMKGWESCIGEPTVGRHSRIAIDGNDKVHIAYTDEVSKRLMHATDKSGTWVITTVDPAATPWASSRGPKAISIAIDSQNRVHLSSQQQEVGNPFVTKGVRYHYADASGTWVTTMVDTWEQKLTRSTAIAIGCDDSVKLLYRVGFCSKGTCCSSSSNPNCVSASGPADYTYELKLATLPIGADPNVSSSWNRTVVDVGGVEAGVGVGQIGENLMVGVDSNDDVHLVHLDDGINVPASGQYPGWAHRTDAGTPPSFRDAGSWAKRAGAQAPYFCSRTSSGSHTGASAEVCATRVQYGVMGPTSQSRVNYGTAPHNYHGQNTLD
eukprot:COSAG01_NODE_89_length_27311_cov_22.687061_10_plen_820_part_00